MKIYQILDEYFKKLDKATTSSDGFFKDESDKERYETSFMYSFHKFQAAKYHFNNVVKFLNKDYEQEKEANIQAELTYNKIKTKISKIRATSTNETSSNHYVYELSAFLEALKSGIDFLAAVCENHLKGINLDSITPLIRLVKKGISGYILNPVKKHLNWLGYIRDYRHHLVHRKLFNISTLRKSSSIGDKQSKIYRPIVIPKNPPKYDLDTRKIRMFQDSNGIDLPYSERIFKIDDEIIDYKIEYEIPEDFIPIEKFMKNNLVSFEEFFAEIIKDLTSLSFNEILIS